jgi:hypothetical protein
MRMAIEFDEFVKVGNRRQSLIGETDADRSSMRPRHTGDIDFLVEPTRVNAQRVMSLAGV